MSPTATKDAQIAAKITARQLAPAPASPDFALALVAREAEAILVHSKKVVGGQDPEDLHHLRVSLRRLRVLLSVVAPLEPGRYSSVKDRLREVTRSFGVARDMDVQAQLLVKELKRLRNKLRRGAGPLREYIERGRARARSALMQRIRSDGYRRLLQDLQTLLDGRPDVNVGAIVVAPENSAAASVLRRMKSLTRACNHLGEESKAEEFHRARIRVKKLRYTVELFVGILPAGVSIASQAASLQAVLGERQDYEVLRDLIQKANAAQSGPLKSVTDGAAAAIIKAADARCSRLAVMFIKRYEKLEAERWKDARRKLRRFASRQLP